MNRGLSLEMNGPDPVGRRLPLIAFTSLIFVFFYSYEFLLNSQVVSSDQDKDEEGSDRSHGYGRNQWNAEVRIGSDKIGLDRIVIELK